MEGSTDHRWRKGIDGMTTYAAPIEEFQFIFENLLSLDDDSDLDSETLLAILREAGKLASEVHVPANVVGDIDPPTLEGGQVKMPPGWREMHETTARGGWIGTSQHPDHGGQGLPVLLNSAILEVFCGANMAYGLCLALTEGAIETLENVASDDLKRRFIPGLISGSWTGTMNLTEPQAGSNLAAIKTKAIREGEHYRIAGQKTFISFGDHDLTENIIHLVLARVEGAPEGVNGISLFVVPKYLVNEDGTLGPRNEVVPISLEHKLGLHGSPTTSISYGDDEGAIGYLVGDENRGLEYMFIMMNRERHMCGVQAIGVGEMALQHATAYANERIQGTPLGRGSDVPIREHPDVERMLMTMRASVDAVRALACFSAAMIDAGKIDRAAQVESEFLTPIVKAWSTDVGFEVASLGMQVFGGLGYIEQTGAAQYLRDVRVTSIYEGTNGIQANDLVFRKVLRDGGETVRRILARASEYSLSVEDDHMPTLAYLGKRLTIAVTDAMTATDAIIAMGRDDARNAAAVAVPYLRLMGIVIGGHYMVKSAVCGQRMLDSGAEDDNFLRSKVRTSHFYVDHILCQSSSLVHTIVHGVRVSHPA